MNHNVDTSRLVQSDACITLRRKKLMLNLFYLYVSVHCDRSFYIKSTFGTWIIRPEGQKVYGKAFQMCLPFLNEELHVSKRFYKEDAENFVVRRRLTQRFLCLIFAMETFPSYMNVLKCIS